MANYGPAIFQVLADSVGRMEKNDGSEGAHFYPWSQHTLYEKFEFVEGGSQANDDFKNNLFRVIMLRARNHLIRQILDDPTILDDPKKNRLKPASVKIELTLYDDTIHPEKAPLNAVIQQAIKSDEQDYIELPDGQTIGEVIYNRAHLGCGSNSNKVEAALTGELAKYSW